MRAPFFVVSEDQAKAIKARWWFWVRFELIAWALCFALGYSLLETPLREAHWPAWVYWAIIGCSLLLFSRLVIWLTLVVAGVAFAVGWAAYQLGHPLYPPVPGYVLVACIMAIIIRSPVGLFYLRHLGDSAREGTRQAKGFGIPEEPEDYDPVTDEHVFEDGRRERAFLRRKSDEDEDHYRG